MVVVAGADGGFRGYDCGIRGDLRAVEFHGQVVDFVADGGDGADAVGGPNAGVMATEPMTLMSWEGEDVSACHLGDSHWVCDG